MLNWLFAGALAYWGYGYVKRTVERGKARSLDDARRKAPRADEPPRSRTPHEVLGVSRDAAPEEVSRAYKALVAQYHPDKLAKSAPELQDLAARRLRELNVAYAALTRGERR